MKISEAIKVLQNLLDNHGDMSIVRARYGDTGGWEEVSDVVWTHHYFQHHDDGGSYDDRCVEFQ